MKEQRWAFVASTGDLVLLCCSLPHFTGIVLFLQMEGKILHQQKDYNSLYCGGLQYLPGMPALNGFHEPILR